MTKDQRKKSASDRPNSDAAGAQRSGLGPNKPAVEGPLLPWLLSALAPMSRTRVKELLQHGQVVVNGLVITRHDHPLQPGDDVRISYQKPLQDDLTKAGLSVLHMDEHILLVDKPSGLLTVATEGEKILTAFALLLNHLQARKQGRPFVVHRIDRETSGLLLFARSAEVRDRLQAQWSQITKTYLGVVEGKPKPAQGTVRSQLREGQTLRVHQTRDTENSKLAVTHYKLLSTRGAYSLVEVELETGRKHQIRVHMADLGSPIIGDTIYGAQTNPARRLGLHAWRLELNHPVTGELMSFTSPLPAALAKFVDAK